MADKPNIYQRLHAVMGEVDYVQKEKKAGMNYTIVSHDAVTAKVRPILHQHGIVYHPHSLDYVQDGNRTQVSLVVRFVNVDQPSDFVDVPCLGFGIDTQDKGPGKAVSYAVKYALLKALGLETGDDPDTEAQTPPHETARQQAAAKAPTKAEKPQPAGIDEARQNAVSFKDKLIADIRKCGSYDDLNRVNNASATVKALAALHDRHRDLWDEVMATVARQETAIAERAAA